MKVIVKESGFYGGTWFDKKSEAQEMPQKIATQFMQPYGHQLETPPTTTAKTETAQTLKKADTKPSIKA